VEILVPKVLGKVEIGGNWVENWCQIGEKREAGWFKINLFCGQIEDPVEKQRFSWVVIR